MACRVENPTYGTIVVGNTHSTFYSILARQCKGHAVRVGRSLALAALIVVGSAHPTFSIA
ncbi:MAG: hypothetical protein IIB58_06530 [Planctomycetes bacterium]|nr:hypothetical protein [Planctomycetota bacterium]